MSNTSGPSSDVRYDPLPLQGPPSPSTPPQALLNSPILQEKEHPGDISDMTITSHGPRFLGQALYDNPSTRESLHDSYAESQHIYGGGRGSEYNSSVYALNNAGVELAERYHDDPNAPAYGGTPMSPMGSSRSQLTDSKHGVYASPRSQSRRIIIIAIAASAILLALAIIIPVYLAVVKKPSNNDAVLSSDGGGGGSVGTTTAKTGKPTGAGSVQSTIAVTGGNGSKVTLEDGSTFIYINPFGGQWYWDENDPFNNGAQAQSYTPALNETFKFGEDRIYGVNLGGWLVTEPFIAPALYEPYENDTNYVVDEWTLCERLKSDGKLNILEQHYSTFITEKDFAEIAAAGLNWVRIPLGWWAIETRDTEPFIANTSWTYFLKAIQWARKYGIRINLDLHAIPGSQNGWNHSGRLGSINFLNGPMGFANAQRALDYIRILAEFVSQPQYSSVVAMFGILNEPVVSTFGQSQLSAFYLQAYDVVRKASGTGEGKGPFISFHNGFLDLTEWSGVYPNADRIALDSHPYIAFGGQSDAAMSTYATTPCTAWGASFNTSMSSFGLTTAGEFSNAVTDCGKYLNGVNLGVRYEGTYTGGTYERVGSCDPWVDYENYSTDMKESIRTFAMASMDALQNWFFWAWKIGNSSVTGKVPSPAWSYQLGLQHGWMPTDPRSAMGQCKNTDPWTPPLQAWQTGGSGAGDIPASVTNSLVWPPATVSNAGAVTLLPSYTPTGTVPTLSPPKFSFSAATATPSVGNGWMNSADTAGMMVNIPACRYLDPWVGPASDPPSPLC